MDKNTKKRPVFAVVCTVIACLLLVQGNYFSPTSSAVAAVRQAARTFQNIGNDSGKSNPASETTTLLGTWIYGASAGGFDVREYAITGHGTYWTSQSIGAQYKFKADNTFEYFWNSTNLRQYSRGKFRVSGNTLTLYDIIEDVQGQYTNKRVDDRTYSFEIDHNEWGRRLTTVNPDDFKLVFRNESGRDDPHWAGLDPKTSQEPAHFTGDITPFAGMWVYVPENIASVHYWSIYRYRFGADRTFEFELLRYDGSYQRSRGKFGVRGDQFILYGITQDGTGEADNRSVANEIYHFEIFRNRQGQLTLKRITPAAWVGANQFIMDFVSDNDGAIILAALALTIVK